MPRDQRRRRSGAPPRARRRGRVPSLPLERASPGALLGHRRCHEYAGPQPLCAAHRTRFRPWCGRQMDRRREPERAWRSLGSDPPQPQPDDLGEAMDEARRFLALPCPPIPSPTNLGHMPPAASGSSEAARRLFQCRTPRSRHAGRGLSARPWHHRTARLARLALSPVGLLSRDGGRSARKLAGAACRRHRSRRQYHRHPAHLARSTAARQGAACRSAPCPRSSARQWRALRQSLPPRSGHSRRRRRRRDHAGAQIGAALIACDCRALGQPPRRPRSLPPAPRRLYVARDNDAAGLKAANRLHERGDRRRHRNPRARAGPWRLQPRSLPSRPRGHAGTSRGSARPLRPDALSARYPPLRSAAVSPSVISVHSAPRRKEEGLFVCGDGVPQPEKSRACGLPERRSAGGEAGLQWRRPTIFRRRADHQRTRPWGARDQPGFASRSKIAARRHPPLCSGPTRGATRLRRRPRDRREGRDRRG